MRRHFFAVTLLATGIVTAHSRPSYALLIDDFSVEQVGISSNQYPAYDFVRSSQIFQGVRLIWGNITASVDGNVMAITPGADRPGTGNVSWTGVASDHASATYGMNVDLSKYVGIEVEIAELTGTAWTRFSIGSGRSESSLGSWNRVDVFFDTPGQHRILFSDFDGYPSHPIVLDNVNNITIQTFLDLGEFVAFDSVRLVVPEPSTAILVIAAVSAMIGMRIRR